MVHRCFICAIQQIKDFIEDDPETGYINSLELIYHLKMLEISNKMLKDIIDKLEVLLYNNASFVEILAELEIAQFCGEQYLKTGALEHKDYLFLKLTNAGSKLKIAMHLEFPLKIKLI